MTYQELYAVLSQCELRNVASRAHLSLADVRQEALLRCWQIASGRSEYRADCGSVRQYVMGQLWGLAARERELRTVTLTALAEDGVAAESYARRLVAGGLFPSVLDVIIAELDDERLTERLDGRFGGGCRYHGASSMLVLMDEGISSGRIAALSGVSPQAVRQRVARERDKLTELQGSKRADRSKIIDSLPTQSVIPSDAPRNAS